MRRYELILQEGIQAGQFGGPIEPHGDHAMGFVAFSDAVEATADGVNIDIGTGAGLPGLVLADALPGTHWLLVDRRSGRIDLLRRAIKRLGLEHRVDAVAADVADLGRGEWRGEAGVVTARSFGPPGDTAEVAAPLLRPGGSLIVSEPPGEEDQDRWPEAGLRQCGLTHHERWTTNSGTYSRFLRTDDEIDDLPRKGARKTPLF
ncbi:MAG: hypothetical protein HKN94_03675 [Acidimicrobiales bacterium]|nr:class I SAM-dependent methyltransferase [Acidimicrobiia bacterium]NNC79232.1 hypothetical protein [Acidimicrobiales bacterium]